jgi:2,4-dienoyl-CoA reductase-like NADH-dependent reductase (Old Yellow Enzyme family)
VRPREITREEIKAAVQGFVDATARALIADPFLYRHMQEGVQGPQCDFCNACYSRAAVWPVDCYNEEVRAQRDRMLRAEVG